MTNEDINSLVLQTKSGSDAAFEALHRQFLPLIQSCVSRFSENPAMKGADPGDLSQLASLALYKAAMRYDLSQSSVTFGLYAKICLNRRLTSEVRRRTSKKRRSPAPAPAAPAKHPPIFSAGDTAGEKLSRVLSLAKKELSPFELTVFKLYLSGHRYQEIADMTGRSVKSVDNAVCRAKKKLRRLSDRD